MAATYVCADAQYNGTELPAYCIMEGEGNGGGSDDEMMNYTIPEDKIGTCEPLGDMDWEDLQKYENLRDAANQAGYTAETWENNKTAWNDLDWEELTPQIQEAEMVLGYTMESWNRCD